MAQNLSAFLAQNAIPAENVKFAASKRYLGEDKKPLEWIIRPANSAEDDVLRTAATRNLPAPGGRKGMFLPQLDTNAYLGRLAAACTVYPDLNDAALQDSYHIMGADALLKAMLLPGEYAAYLAKVQEACGFDVTMGELADEAKN